MVTTVSQRAPLAESRSVRGRVTSTSLVVCLVLAGVYAWMFFAIRDVEVTAGLETTYGAYLFLMVGYATGAVLLLLVDRRVIWAIGVAVQGAVLGLYFAFGAAIFDYPEVAHLPLNLWVTVTLVGESLLIGLLGYLALTPVVAPGRVAAAPGHDSGETGR